MMRPTTLVVALLFSSIGRLAACSGQQPSTVAGHDGGAGTGAGPGGLTGGGTNYGGAGGLSAQGGIATAGGAAGAVAGSGAAPAVGGAADHGGASASGGAAGASTAEACAGDLPACVQEASDRGGGTVVLAAKRYLLSQTLELRSGVALQGQGRGTIITWDDSVKGIIDAPLLHTTSADDVSLKDLTLLCAINQDAASSDLRNDHMALFFDCGGDPTADEATECNRLTLERLEVAYCSHGIHIKGATGVQAVDLELHHNGNTEQDLFHNIYYRRVADLVAKQTTATSGGYHSSPRGHGIRASFIKNAYLEGLAVYGNADHGIHLADTIIDMRLHALDVHDNCAQPVGTCAEIQCYGSCDVDYDAPREP